MNKWERRWKKWELIVSNRMGKELYRQAQRNGYRHGPKAYLALLQHRYENQTEPRTETRW